MRLYVDRCSPRKRVGHFVIRRLRPNGERGDKLAALTSVVLALSTVGITLLLTWASRSRFVDQGLPRLDKEDWLVWADLVVTGGLALFFLVVTKNKHHELSMPYIGTLSTVIFICATVLPSVVNDRVYDKAGNIKGWKEVWAVNTGGFLILLLAVALGAEIHG